jgi:hypothetical protein
MILMLGDEDLKDTRKARADIRDIRLEDIRQFDPNYNATGREAQLNPDDFAAVLFCRKVYRHNVTINPSDGAKKTETATAYRLLKHPFGPDFDARRVFQVVGLPG